MWAHGAQLQRRLSSSKGRDELSVQSLNLSLPPSISSFLLLSFSPSLPPSSLPSSLPFPHPYLLSVYASSVLFLRKHPVHAHVCTYLWKPDVNLGCVIPQVPPILVFFRLFDFLGLFIFEYMRAYLRPGWVGLDHLERQLWMVWAIIFRFWEPNSGLLREEQVPLPEEPFLQHPSCIYFEVICFSLSCSLPIKIGWLSIEPQEFAWLWHPSASKTARQALF